jgi:hypothetical protein
LGQGVGKGRESRLPMDRIESFRRPIKCTQRASHTNGETHAVISSFPVFEIALRRLHYLRLDIKSVADDAELIDRRLQCKLECPADSSAVKGKRQGRQDARPCPLGS